MCFFKGNNFVCEDIVNRDSFFGLNWCFMVFFFLFSGGVRGEIIMEEMLLFVVDMVFIDIKGGIFVLG